ncbi:MAG: hypothetical protein PHC45_06070 [Clostridiaceae bacterium]|nr:hypothetical protein [Clostridiaceae bacterium]
MDFLKVPFIPDRDVSLVIVDYRISPVIESNLKAKGIECVKTVRCQDLYDSVDGHPDMLMFHLRGNNIVLAPNIYESMEPMLTKKGFAVTKGATWLERNYPGNIAYNILRVGDAVFHNIKHTDPEITKALRNENVKILNVKQGYTKCSVCILNDKTIITSDARISEIAEKYGIESFFIKPGGIDLKGMNYGFLGGASGLLSKSRIAFSGNLESIEDNHKLIDFISAKGFEIEYLSDEKAVDYGSILPLKCR